MHILIQTQYGFQLFQLTNKSIAKGEKTNIRNFNFIKYIYIILKGYGITGILSRIKKMRTKQLYTSL